MTLTARQRAAWERDGFLVLPGFVASARCDDLRHHVEDMLAGIDPASEGSLTVFDTEAQSHGAETWFLESGDKIRWFLEPGAVEAGELVRPFPLAVNKLGHAMHDLDPVFDRFSRTPELAALASELGPVDAGLLQSMYIFKQPGIGGEVDLHCDHSFLWTEPASVTGFWFAIEDATLDNGCLWALPGGHRLPPRIRFRRDGVGTVTDRLVEEPYPDRGLVPLEAERGTVVVLHGLLPHRSGPNTSRQSRHAYTLHLIGRGADYPTDNWLQRPGLPLRGFS